MSDGESLSKRERQIMDALYARGEATVSEVQTDLASPADAPSYNSVRNLMKILENKGHLRHRVDGLRYVYAPRKAASSAASGELARVVRTFFSGSVERVVATLLGSDEARLTHEEAARLATLIARATQPDEAQESKNDDDSP